MDYTEQTLSAREVFRGKIFTAHVDEVSLPDGRTSVREIVEHPGGAAILPVDKEGFAYCVRQYRYAVGTHMLEAPAGKLEPGEDPLICAARELGEETGFTAERIVPLGSFWPSPGYCRERIFVYLALGLTKGEAHLDKGEFLDVEKYPLETLFEMTLDGRIDDCKTVMAVLRAKLYLDGKRGNNA